MPTLTIQPSTADNQLRSAAPTTNYGTATPISVGMSAGEYNNGIFSFDFSALPNGTTILTAPLSCYHCGVGGETGRTYWLYRATRTNWTELGSCWDNYKSGSAWTTAGGDFTTTNGASAVTPAINNWMQWSVLAQCQYAQVNTSKIAHFILKAGTEEDGHYSQFYSNNYAVDTTLCPKLILTYRYNNGLWFGNG